MDAHAALVATATLRYATLSCASVEVWIGVASALAGTRFGSQHCHSPLKGLPWQGTSGAAIGGDPPPKPGSSHPHELEREGLHSP